MPTNPEYTKYARLTSGLAFLELVLIGVGCYLAYDFIQSEPEDLGREIGIYIGMGFAIAFALAMTVCACTSNNKTIIQAFTCMSFFFFVVFVIIGAVTFATVTLTDNSITYASLSLVIAGKHCVLFYFNYPASGKLHANCDVP